MQQRSLSTTLTGIALTSTDAVGGWNPLIVVKPYRLRRFVAHWAETRVARQDANLPPRWTFEPHHLPFGQEDFDGNCNQRCVTPELR